MREAYVGTGLSGHTLPLANCQAVVHVTEDGHGEDRATDAVRAAAVRVDPRSGALPLPSPPRKGRELGKGGEAVVSPAVGQGGNAEANDVDV